MRLALSIVLILGSVLFINAQEGNCNLEVSKKALKLYEKGIDKIKFDRGGYLYHGKIKSFAEGVREGGLTF